MAQKISIQLIDDIDQSEAAETIHFSIGGDNYVIDLSEQNARALRDALAPFVAHAQKDTRVRGGRARASRGGNTASVIRAWARENGYEVPERGRVASDIKAAYDAAH